MKEMTRPIGRALLLGALCTTACRPSQAQVVYMVSAATIDGSIIRLRDVVVQADALPEGWGGRVVGNAPQPGGGRTLGLGSIAAALHSYDDMHDVELRGQPEIRLTVRAKSVDADMLDRVIAEYLDQRPELGGRRLRVAREQLPVVQGGETITNAVVMGIREDSQRVALIRLEGPDYRMPAEGVVEFPLNELQAYWMVVRPLLRGATLADGDIAEKWIPAEEGARYYPVSDRITGMEIRRNLQTGQLLQMGALADPVFVKRGEIVSVLFDQGGLSVTLRARALSDGRRAERIACVNERSGRRMYVRLVDVREAVYESEGTGG